MEKPKFQKSNNDSSARPQIAFGEESCYVPLAVKSYCWKLLEESKIVDQGRTIKEDPGKGLGEGNPRETLGNPKETQRKP